MITGNILKFDEKEPHSIEVPLISIVVATCNRSSFIKTLLGSVVELEYSNFELIIVDQSDNDATKEVLAQTSKNINLHYIHSNKKGVSFNRNLGILAANSDFVAITDDDCVVTTNWLSEMSRIFQEQPEVGLIFGQVLAAEHDPSKGFIPKYVFEKPRLCHYPIQVMFARGMGACMGIRKQIWSELQGFDEMLGPGAKLRACEDGDIALRAILFGSTLLETPEVKVIHYGFRTYEEGEELTKRDWFGIGAAYAKYIRCKNWVGIMVLLYEFTWVAGGQAIIDSIRLRRPSGLKRMYNLIIGAIASYNFPIDKKSYRYQNKQVFEKDN